jgi:hypothetical protein
MIKAIVLALALSAGAATAARAFEAYTKPVFEQAVASGKPVVVHVHADW